MEEAGDGLELEDGEDDEDDDDNDGEGDESANSSFVAMEDAAWLFVSSSSLLRCVVVMEMLTDGLVLIVPGILTLLLWPLAATLAPSLCRIVMSNTLAGSSCVMMIGGSPDQLLLAFNPETPTGSHSLTVLVSLTDSLTAETLFAVESGRTTDSIIVGDGLMTANSLVSLDEAVVTVIVSPACDVDDDDDAGDDDDVVVVGEDTLVFSFSSLRSFEAASFFSS